MNRPPATRAGGTYALFLASTLIWGSTWIAITYQLGAVPPEVSVAYRFALASAILLGWSALAGVRLRYPRRDHLFMAAQGGLLFGANYVLIYHAERFLASGLVAVVFSLIVFCNIVGMRVFFGRPMTVRMLLGASIGVAGVALLFWPELARFQGGARGATGLALAALGTVVASLGNLVAARNHRAGLPVRASAGFGMLYGTALVVIWILARGIAWRFDGRPAYLASLVYLALFGSVLAFVAYLTLVGAIGADRAGYVGVAIPVVALALSTLLEGYRWSAPAVSGVLLCLAGNVLVLRQAAPAPPDRSASGSERSGSDDRR